MGGLVQEVDACALMDRGHKVGDRKLLIRDPKGHGRGHLITYGYRGGLGTYIWDPHHYAAHSVTNTLLHYHRETETEKQRKRNKERDREKEKEKQRQRRQRDHTYISVFYK